MTESSGPPLCPDWVFFNLSNVHVAKDRGWFKTYTPYTSTVCHSPYIPTYGHSPVLGIGTVEVPTKRAPNLSGVASHGSLHLKEVLHVPNFICNVIGVPIMSSDGYDIRASHTSKSKGTITDSEGKNMAYFDPKSRFLALKIRKHPTGAAEEVPPYTADEKIYLKGDWRNEYHFLLEHGLKIYKEEDRAESQSILRAFKDKDAVDEKPEDDELGLEGHQADYNFSPSQLVWIEESYGNSENFMLSYGLRFYDDDDCKEAKAIADAMTALVSLVTAWLQSRQRSNSRRTRQLKTRCLHGPQPRR